MPSLRPIALCLGLLAACRPSAPTNAPASEPSPAPEVTAIPSPSVPEALREPDDLRPLLEPVVELMQVPGLGVAVVDREGLVAIGVAGKRHIERPELLQRIGYSRLTAREQHGSELASMKARLGRRSIMRRAMSGSWASMECLS